MLTKAPTTEPVLRPERRSRPVPEPAHSDFRPDIEGLRGVAILLVVLFHCGVPGFGGGYIGVDVFFALSGYLITSLILREIEKKGRLSFSNFYARRARRLLPAACLVIVVILLAGMFVYSPLEMSHFAKWARYTSLYISNFMFTREAANYFASDVALNPFLHTWSLAVEEQFYIFWPALIVITLMWVKSRRNLARVLAALALASFAVCIWLTRSRLPWAFFGLPARAWEFALGGLGTALGADLLLRWNKPIRWLGWLGAAAVLLSGCLLSARMRFPGYLAFFPVAGTVLVLVAGADAQAGIATFLGNRFLQYFGRLSYSWYLWHWPVLLAAKACFPAIPWIGKLVAAGLALLLAQVAFTLVERPIRTSRFLLPRPALSLAMAGFIAVFGIAASLLVQRRVDAQLASPAQFAIRVAADEPRPLFEAHCLTRSGSSRVIRCNYGEPTGSKSMLLFGDSHAEQWYPALQLIAKERHWKLITFLKASCPAADVTVFNSTLKRLDGACTQWRKAALKKIVSLRPDLVVISESDNLVGRPLANGSDTEEGASPPVTIEDWRQGLHRTLTYLGSNDVKTLLIADTPRAPGDVPTCLSRMTAHSWAAHDCSISRNLALNFEARSAEAAAINELPLVKVADFTDALCNSTSCSPVLFDHVVYRDSNHLTAGAVLGLVPLLRERISGLTDIPSEAANSPEQRIMASGSP